MRALFQSRSLHVRRHARRRANARVIGVVAWLGVALLSSALSTSWWVPGFDVAPASAGAPPGAVNSVSRIAYSMAGPNESPLQGVPASYSWGAGPQVEDPTDSVGYSAVTAWGLVYAAAGAAEPAQRSVRVELKNMQLYVWSRSHRTWISTQWNPQVDGAHYAEDFANNASIGADWRAEPDGGVSSALVDGYNLHFWPVGDRGTVTPSDVGAVYVTVAARLIGPGADGARYLADTGADWWLNRTAAYPDNDGVGTGRFMDLSTSWQAFDFYTGGSYGPAPTPPRWNWFGLLLSNPPIDAMGHP